MRNVAVESQIVLWLEFRAFDASDGLPGVVQTTINVVVCANLCVNVIHFHTFSLAFVVSHRQNIERQLDSSFHAW